MARRASRVLALAVGLLWRPWPRAGRGPAGQRSVRGVDLVNVGVTVTRSEGRRSSPTHAGRFRDPRGRPAADGALLRGRRRRAGARRTAPGGDAGRQREHGRGHRLHPDRRDQVPEHPRPRPSTSRSSTSTPRCASRATARRVRAAGRADPAAEGRAADTALYDAHRRLSRRRGRPGRAARSCCSTPTAATPAARIALQRAADAAQGLRRHRSTRSACSSTRLPVGKHEQRDRSCGRSPKRPAARRSSRRRVKELDAVYDQVVAEIRAQYTLGYLSTNRRADGRGARSRSSVHRPDREGPPRRGRARATSRRLRRRS